jgi:hypothetical protein
MRLGTPGLPDEDFTKSLGMLATFCTEKKFPLPEWILNIGKTYGIDANTTSSNKGQVESYLSGFYVLYSPYLQNGPFNVC